jgi:hypothetical protein
LVAGLAIGAGATVAASASRSGPHWLGEILRACELMQSRNSQCRTEARQRISSVFAAALERALAPLNLTAGGGSLDRRDVGDVGVARVDKSSLRTRGEAWESREKRRPVD